MTGVAVLSASELHAYEEHREHTHREHTHREHTHTQGTRGTQPVEEWKELTEESGREGERELGG